MSTSNQNPPESSEEQRFIQRAMAAIDKAEKVQKIKQVVVMGLLFGALVWLAIRTPGPGLNNAFVILVVAIGIAKIHFRIDSSTRAILRALANRR
jgi:uncharacterized membrane protein YbjE (DUF340 family)